MTDFTDDQLSHARTLVEGAQWFPLEGVDASARHLLEHPNQLQSVAALARESVQEWYVDAALSALWPLVHPGQPRTFTLERDEDPTGVSGTGTIAWGTLFPDGTAVLRWNTPWPASVVHYDRGLESIEHVHGHGGLTRIVWADAAPDRLTASFGECGPSDTFDAWKAKATPAGDVVTPTNSDVQAEIDKAIAAADDPDRELLPRPARRRASDR